ncbi:hypothetical protein [Corynebacterium rouxii]|uniref:Uncharacterized protein n=1 Tax=Corynebacterium rouxii TaxID=2719119 RepID=A0ABU3PPS1_9CORY|nr:hypothetical protein [Corynebacterium rouxii]MDT9409577.1 hypothetical protein [Corynebacterium rouxii]MDT9411810.1 hypothetical protein [Corynebacterium rouxii]
MFTNVNDPEPVAVAAAAAIVKESVAKRSGGNRANEHQEEILFEHDLAADSSILLLHFRPLKRAAR